VSAANTDLSYNCLEMLRDLKSASAIGLTIRRELLLRADVLIE